MHMNLPLYQRVALKRDLPAYELRRGDVAVLVDYVQHPQGGDFDAPVPEDLQAAFEGRS